MPILQDVFGHSVSRLLVQPSPLLVSDSCVGVEIELELLGGHDIESSVHWRLEQDGSLRNNGIEFIFREPMWGQDIVNALIEVEEVVTHFKSSMDVSDSQLMDDNTSVHVHIDARDLSDEELINFVLLSIFFERVLINYASPERENNIFTLPLTRAEGDINACNRVIKSLMAGERSDIHYNIQDMSKYSATNFQALSKYGSVEFRSHRGEYRAARIREWINLLLCVKEAARGGAYTADTLMNIVHKRSPTAIVEAVFKEHTLAIIEANPQLEKELFLGGKVLNEIIVMTPTRTAYSMGRLASYEKDSLVGKYVEVNNIASTPTDATDFVNALLNSIRDTNLGE